jgi:thiamine pyrophosphokinase
VIIGGAKIGDYDAIGRFLRPGDFFCYCDSGLFHRDRLGAAPDLIVGDFDSHPRPDLPVETITLPTDKDDTDTFYAAGEGLVRGYEDFLLLGVTGGRLDHTLGNLSILLRLDTLGKRGKIVDDYSEAEVVSGRLTACIPDSFAFFSLLNISGAARGIRVRDAKYPLENAEIGCDYPYGVSNEVLPGRIASVHVEEGRLLLIKIRR